MRKTISFLALFASMCSWGQTALPTDVTLSFPLNGNATDLSVGSYAGTMIGGVSATTDRFGNPSGAVLFDGSNGYIDIPYNTSVGTSDFSISYWACPSTGNTACVFSKEQTLNANNQFRMGGVGDYSACFSNVDNSFGGGLASIPAENVWAFYTLTRSGVTMNLYINGVLQSTLTTGQPINQSNTLNYRIGATYNAASFYSGKVDDLKLFKHALTTEEITALYTYQNNALAFDGVNDYVSAPLATTTQDNVTLEAWVNWKGTTGKNQFIVLNGNSGSSGYALYVNNWQNANGNVVGILCGGVAAMSSVQTLTPNTWQHLAAVKNNGTWKLYINGVVATLDMDGAIPNIPTASTFIGSSNVPGDENFNGLIDEVRIWNVARTQSEILSTMGGLSSPSTATGLAAYYTFDQGNANADNTILTSLTDASAVGLHGTLHSFDLTGTNSNWVSGFVSSQSVPQIPATPTVSTQAISDIQSSSATGNGTILTMGVPRATQYGMVWSTSAHPTVALSSKTEEGLIGATGSFVSYISGLMGNTLYYVKAYATNSEGTVYGDEVSFTTAISSTVYPNGSSNIPSWYYDNLNGTGMFTNPKTGLNGNAIDDAAIQFTTFNQTDAYDGAFEFFINSSDSVYTDPGVIVQAGNNYQLAEQLIDSFYVSKSYYFSPTEPVVRTLYKIRNVSDKDRSAKLGTYSNMGSDGATAIMGCSTASPTLSDADRWMVTSDGADYNTSDPINTWVRFGPGLIKSVPKFGQKPGLTEEIPDSYLDTIPLIIPANDYVLVMQINRMDSTVAAALENTTKFDNGSSLYSAGYLAGLNTEEMSKVVNWDLSNVQIATKLKNTAAEIALYPNPAQDFVVVNVGEKVCNVSICDLNGSLLLSQQAIGTTYMNIQSLRQGVYLVKANGWVKKLVKR